MDMCRSVFYLLPALLLAGCNTTSLESAAPATANAPATTSAPPPVASQVNDPFMLEVVGQCRIKIANDSGVKTDAVTVGTMTPSPDGNGQFIEGVVKGGKKFRCNYDGIGNFLNAQPV